MYYRLVKLTTLVDVSWINRHPVDQFKWEVKKITKRIRYSLAILKAEDFFGHQDLEKSLPRNYTASSLGRWEVFSIDRQTFLKYFDTKDKKTLFEIHKSLDLNELLNVILWTKSYQKKSSEAVLNATKLNYVSPDGRFEYSNQTTLNKLSPWMEKAKRRETSSKAVYEHVKKVKVLNVFYEKFIVGKPLLLQKLSFINFHK